MGQIGVFSLLYYCQDNWPLISGNITFSSVLGFYLVICQQHIGYNLFREKQKVEHLWTNCRRALSMTNFSFLTFSSVLLYMVVTHELSLSCISGIYPSSQERKPVNTKELIGLRLRYHIKMDTIYNRNDYFARWSRIISTIADHQEVCLSMGFLHMTSHVWRGQLI